MYAPATTNPTTVEIGIEYFRPCDALHWIPGGAETVSLVVDQDDLADDYWVFLDQAADAWCASQGYVFSQLLQEP